MTTTSDGEEPRGSRGTGASRLWTSFTSSDCKLLALDRRAFNRLLGPLREMLMGQANRYK